MYSSKKYTREHIGNVRKNIKLIIKELVDRGKNHDKSKLEPPELETFDKYTPLLKTLEYGSYEYKKSLDEMKPALEHHYFVNRHHPEHFESGIEGMNLVDIIEMFCDWYAAVTRMKSGNIHSSIDISAKRFGISPQLVNIFKNSVELLEK